MTRLLAEAPGKLFLLGEYGVLARGWCVVGAVDRRVSATHDARGMQYTIDEQPQDEAAGLALPRAALAQYPGLRSSVLARLSTSVSALQERGFKLGLGSSAASSVALTALLAQLADDDTTQSGVFTRAFAAHRVLQRGRGSGADVAASAFGGWLAYRLLAPQPPFEVIEASRDFEEVQSLGVAEVIPLMWPDELRWEAVWTGAPARSTELIGRVEEARAHDPQAIAAILAQLSSLAETGITSMRFNDPEALLASLRHSDLALERLGQLSGAPIITPKHESLRAIAAPLGIVAKPSGAGGGDLSLLVGPQDADWSALFAKLPDDCVSIPMGLDTAGVQLRRLGS